MRQQHVKRAGAKAGLQRAAEGRLAACTLCVEIVAMLCTSLMTLKGVLVARAAAAARGTGPSHAGPPRRPARQIGIASSFPYLGKILAALAGLK